MKLVQAIAATGACLIFIACSSAEETTTHVAATRYMMPMSGTAGTINTIEATCNSLTAEGPQVTAHLGIGDAPSAEGGTLTDGTYFLTDLAAYGTIPPGTVQGTVVLSGNTLQGVGSAIGITETGSATFTLTGATLNVTDTCPDTAQRTAGYTVTATGMTIIADIANVGTFVATLTKQ